MKFNRIQFAVLIAAVILVPQAIVAHAQDAPAPVQDSTGGPDASPGLARDKMFLNKVAEGGIAEVQLGKLAAQKGSKDDVKSFAQKMVDDHTDLNKQLANVADEMGLRVSKAMNADGKAEYEKLKNMSGSDFDTEYITFMAKAHHEDYREFRTEVTVVTDANLKAFIGKVAPVLREHAMATDKIARDNGIALPGRRQGPPAGATPPPALPQ
jgi:putative membrane protein